jgi:hypothetical protein
MIPQALIELESGDRLVGRLEKLSSASLFISFDKLNNTNKLTIGNQYFVSVAEKKERVRILCKLIQYDQDLVFLQPLHPKTK